MTQLLRKPQSSPDGTIHCITPEDARWSFVGFEVHDLKPGQTLARAAQPREFCLVLISGHASIAVAGRDLGKLGDRGDPFVGKPWSAYIPAGARWLLLSETACEIAIGSAPAQGVLPPRIIAPTAVEEVVRGSGTNLRRVRNILPEGASAESLLVVEVITPGGHWSSYPPHKHDTDDPPRECYLEETYYHRLARRSGFAIQRVYTADASLDETMAVADRDVVLVPRGYHPVGAPHGFDLYYLNIMAGPVRSWKFTLAPEHAFLGW
jgi:5-deoxy-glucuronate isomerase